MKNIFQIWKENGCTTPFCVSKGNEKDQSIYVIVHEVVPNESGYGVAYGIPVTNGVLNTYFDYNKKWVNEKVIPNAGTYNWKLRNDVKVINNVEICLEPDVKGVSNKTGKLLGLEDYIDFGKYKGSSIKHILETDKNYLKWANENVKSLKLSREVFEILK
ncbi:MAG: hypothetical protein JXR88_13640 [Clostridia bacterium]|nr:hypothetical protein [Clostridia bacterium]